MNEIFIQNPRRQSYQIFKDKLEGVLAKLGQSFDPENALIMPYLVRVHTALVNGKSNYVLDLVTGTSSLLGVEKKIEKSDILMIQSIGLGLQKYDPASPDFAGPIFNYPDPVYFTAATAAQLNKIYEGKLSMKVGSQTIIDSLDNLLLKFVPNGNFAGTVGTPTDLAEVGASNEARGLQDLGSYPILIGDNKNQVEISLAPGDISAIASTGTGTNNLVFLALGWVYRGSVGNNGQCSI